MSSSAATLGPSSTAFPVNSRPDTAMERILQEISTEGCRLEAMDSKITDLSADSKSIWADIAGFQDKDTDLDHRLHTIESRIAAVLDKEPEMQFLRHKLKDLEDRRQRDNVHLFGLPEKVEGTDLRAFLKDFIPTLTGLTFSPMLEFL
ncbi:hypothetical protein NDU88_000916 [Pleurodeles waltl]|uniref:Uncharacterized protein n=1 Tax=Pleurodeles waltl TaxID=8319 RepID=A0AAV7WL35_PLEWA|nr:hypothetical protein NDU88_000916 [Pleurodeles waltl]